MRVCVRACICVCGMCVREHVGRGGAYAWERREGACERWVVLDRIDRSINVERTVCMHTHYPRNTRTCSHPRALYPTTDAPPPPLAPPLLLRKLTPLRTNGRRHPFPAVGLFARLEVGEVGDGLRLPRRDGDALVPAEVHLQPLRALEGPGADGTREGSCSRSSSSTSSSTSTTSTTSTTTTSSSSSSLAGRCVLPNARGIDLLLVLVGLAVVDVIRTVGVRLGDLRRKPPAMMMGVIGEEREGKAERLGIHGVRCEGPMKDPGAGCEV